MKRISYHGWPDSYLLSNGSVEAIVVPAIGRVMQLRLAGGADGAFWENRALDGRLPDASAHRRNGREWLNFGGDKCWPAPQSAWPRQQGRDWPPPVAFDSRFVEAVATGGGLTLTSPVDPAFGIQIVRHIELDPVLPTMRIVTEYRKLSGDAVRVGVWTITQMRDPERVVLPLPERSAFSGGYLRLIDGEPAKLKIEGGLLSLERNPDAYVKIGSDAASMVWVGSDTVVRIDAEQGEEQATGGQAEEYPDGGCRTQVYTNPDPLPYVELETLGPLANLSVGDRIQRAAAYTIAARSPASPEDEARKALG
jgi:hypothetical protein